MDIVTFNKCLTQHKPFISAAWQVAKQSDDYETMPVKTVHFYFNTNGHHRDRIQLDDENNQKVTTIATIHKQHRFEYEINNEFWAYLPPKKQSSVLSLIQALANTPISKRHELDPVAIKNADQNNEQWRQEQIKQYLESIQPVDDDEDEDIDDEDIDDEDIDDEDIDDEDIDIDDNNNDINVDDDNNYSSENNSKDIFDEWLELLNDKTEDPDDQPMTLKQKIAEQIKSQQTTSASMHSLENLIWEELEREMTNSHWDYEDGKYHKCLFFNNVLKSLEQQEKIFYDDTIKQAVKNHQKQLLDFIHSKCTDNHLNFTEINFTPTTGNNTEVIGIDVTISNIK